MAKKRKKKSSRHVRKPTLQKTATTHKVSNDLWIWPILALLLVGAFFAYKWADSISIAESPSVVRERERFKCYETNLQYHTPEIRQSVLEAFTDKQTAEDIGSSSNLAELVYKVRRVYDPQANMESMNEFISSCVQEISRSGWGPQKKAFRNLVIKQKLEAIASYLIMDKRFIYGSSILDLDADVRGSDGKMKVKEKKTGDTDPAPYTVDHLIKTGIGNCATLPIVYAIIAQRLGLSVKLVGIKDHMFARYESGSTTINIETTSPVGMGVGTPDSFYVDLLKPPRNMLKNSSCMKSLNLRETAGALFITQMAYLSKANASEEDLKRAAAYSLYFNEKSEHAVMNSLQLFTDKNNNEDPLREELLLVARNLGAIPPDKKIVLSMTSQIMALHQQVAITADKIRYKYPQSRHGRIQEIYQRLKNTKDAVIENKLLDELQDISSGRRVYKPVEVTETIYDLQQEVKRHRQQVKEFARDNDDNLSFEQIKIIDQILILSGHNKSALLRLERM